MITIRFNPKALTSEGQIVKKVQFIPQHSVIFYVQMNDFDWHNCDYILSGRVAKADDIVRDGDEIIIKPRVEAPIAAFVAAITAWFAVNAFWAGLAIAVSVGATLYSVISALTSRPRTPSNGTNGSGIDNGSPTYGFDGIGNTTSPGLPVAVVYGVHRVGGMIIGRYVNTDGDLNYLNLLIALCEGEIDSISGIEINGNPIANYNSVSYDTRTGTNGQAAVDNFHETHDTRSVNVNMLSGVAQVFTSIATNVDALAIHLLLPNGLFAEDSSSGNIISATVTYLLEYKLHSAGSYTTIGSINISEQSRTAVRRVYKIDGLTPGQYDVRITKTSSDSTFFFTGDLVWDTVDEIVDEQIAYVNTALLSVTALATNQLSGSEPTFTSIVKATKVNQPQVKKSGVEVDWDTYYYDPVAAAYKDINDDTTLTWDGTTYVTKWSANPVWCLRDLLLNTRYGLGNFIDTTLIDDASFLAMSQYCDNKVPDGQGGYEKRYNLNIVLDASTKAFDMILQVASSFRGLLFYSTGTIKLKIDKADTPVQLFGMGNIQQGSFTQTWLSLKQKFNIIEAQFLNKDLDYIQDTVAVVDEAALAAGDPIRKKQTKLFTTQTSQAIREARYLLWMNKYIQRVVSFKAGIDAIVCEAGDLINVSHDVPAWGQSGRIASGSTTTVINLDRTVVLLSGITYNILVKHSADDSMEERTITTPAGNVNQVTVSSAFSSAPAAYDDYAVGQITIETKPFRILSIQVDNDHNADIMALEYNESIYDDSAPALPTVDYSALSLGIPNITDLALTSGVVKLNDGTINSSIDVWFSRPDGTSVFVMYDKARIYLSDNGGLSWLYIGETNGNHFQINEEILDGTTYKVAVVSVGANGVINAVDNSPQQSILSIGKSAPPSDVPTFLVNQNRDNLFFGWTPVTDLDLSGYEIRYGDSWDAGAILATQLKNSNYQSPNISTGTAQNYFIKAIDSSGNYSTNATQAVITIDSIPFQNIISEFMEAAAWTGTKSSTLVVSSVLIVSTGVLTGTYVTPVRDVGFVATFKIGITAVVVDASGDRQFNDDTTTQFDTDPNARFSGEEISGAASFEIQTSTDNITWSGYSPWQFGDYTCRYFQIRMTLTRQNTGQNIECSDLSYFADLPDVDDFSGTLTVSNASTGLAVLYGKTFHQVPAVSISILSGTGVFAGFASAPDTTGFTVKLYNAAGTAETGTFSYHAHGV